MDAYHGRISYINFNHSVLTQKPDLLRDLSVFYCNIWTYDENFQEYAICPVCSKYYSESQVLSGINTCSGVDSPHEVTNLVKAWIPRVVASDILDLTAKYGNKLQGTIAYDNLKNRVVGFAWGFLTDWNSVESDWKMDVFALLYDGNDKGALYFSELATDPKLREQGIGSKLIYHVTAWMKETYPNLPTFLRTHRNSKARRLFERVGYSYFADDPEHGDGRIMMDVPTCSSLTPEELL